MNDLDASRVSLAQSHNAHLTFTNVTKVITTSRFDNNIK